MSVDDNQRKRKSEEEGIPPFDEAPDGERPSDDDQEIILPGERPLASRDRLTASEQQEGDSVRTRVAREEPEVDAELEEPEDVDETAGRVVEDTRDGRDVTRELEGTESDDDVALSAEEAAVTIREGRQPDEPSTDEAAGRGADRGPD